ncbi:unnamed protein product [Urochloa humidicola]
MVDVDRRPSLSHGLPRPPSHAAGLRRLSTRASAPSTPRGTPAAPPSPSATTASSGPAPSPSAVLAHLAAAGVPVLPGLSATELAVAEATLGGVQLPPDLRDLLSLGVPSGDGFPDYRSPAGLRLLRFAAQEVPAAVAAALPLAPGRRLGRGAPPPPLVPLWGQLYVPATPCLAGNPVFHVSDTGVAFAAANAADFLLRAFAAEPPPGVPLRRQLSAPAPPPQSPAPPSTARRSLDSVTGRAPRWIEFWTDAAAAGDRFLEVPTGAGAKNAADGATAPEWMLRSLERAGAALARGGWAAGEVEEMTAGGADGGEALGLVLTVDRCCGELRRGGWAAEEVVEMLGALLGPRKARRAVTALPPEVAARVGRLAEAVSRAVASRGKAKPPRPS